jgi:NDP-sugar pyrophosphorylase family protein
MQENRVTGELHPGFWMDIGTPERLDELSDLLINQSRRVVKDKGKAFLMPPAVSSPLAPSWV